MSDGFDQGEFDDALDSIETYLGYLKGNDLMQECFDDYQISTTGQAWWPVAFDYTSPCPDSQYAVDFTSFPTINVPVDIEAGTDQQAVLQDLKDDMDESWNNGVAWAAGVAGQMRQICAQFTEPSVSSLTGAIELLQSQVVSRLDLGANDDWLKLGDAQVGWDGQFAYNFRVFYANYNDVIERFGVFCGQITVGFALGARIIAATQLAAGKFASSLQSNLESQLAHWVDNHGKKPTDPADEPAWVGNVAAVVSSTLDLASGVPIVGEAADVKGYYDKTKALVEDVDTLVGGGLLPEKETYEDVMTGSEAYDLLSETLYGFYQDYRDGMDRLDAGGAGRDYEENAFSGSGLLANLKDVKQRGDFALPDVPAANLN